MSEPEVLCIYECERCEDRVEAYERPEGGVCPPPTRQCHKYMMVGIAKAWLEKLDKEYLVKFVLQEQEENHRKHKQILSLIRMV